MQASKVDINPDLVSAKLSKKRKAELRKERALEFIKSKPNGSIIKQSEFVPITGLSPNNVATFLSTLEKQGAIRRERLSRQAVAFYVTDGAVTQPAIDKPEASASRPSNGDVIELLAKKFFWEVRSDSLHEFVNWVRQEGA